MSLAPEDQPASADTSITEASFEVPPAPVAALPKQEKNYELSTPLMSDLSEEGKKKFEGVMIPFLPDTAGRVNDDMISNNLGEIDPNENAVSWYANLLQGFKAHPAHGIFEDALADPKASWRNTLTHNGTNINIGRPKFNNAGRGGAGMSSERLQLSIRARLGLGSSVQVPLMASGFYATVKPLEEAEIISLWREVIAEPIKLGRVTHGLMFSNNQVFTAKAVTMAWLKSMVETTVKDLPLDNIIDHIPINDLPLIAQSVAASVYPNGFPISRSVFTKDTKDPDHEVSQLIDIRKALFMNAAMFSSAQLDHMVGRIGQPMTLKQVQDYREQFKFAVPTAIDLGEGVKLHLQTPSLRQYFDSGEAWINDIQVTVREALGAELDDEVDRPSGKRLQYISQLAKTSRLRQYAHYVKAIEVEEELFNTSANIHKVLTSLSADDVISEKVYKAISDYINTTQCSIIATTSVTEYEDEKTGTQWPRLIPIDAMSSFFQLVEQKLRGITSRRLEDTSD